MVEMLMPHEGARRPPPSVEWLKSPARPALQVAAALDSVRRAPTILSAMRLAPGVVGVTDEALREGMSPSRLLGPIMATIDDDTDAVAAIAAIHALGRVPGTAAVEELQDLIVHGAPGHEEHAIWALYERPASDRLIDPLARAILRGGLVGMHAQRVLGRWASGETGPIVGALKDVLGETALPASRRHLTETIGLISGREARLALERIATDASEDGSVRATAIAAFAERAEERLPASIGRSAAGHGRIAEAVRTVRSQRQLIRRGPRIRQSRHRGLRVAQVHLAALLDDGVSRAGMGDTGGVATLLSRLGAALAEQSRVAEVITIGRSDPDAPAPSTGETAGHRFDHVDLQDGEGAAFASTWPSVVAAERGIRAAMLAAGVPDVVHLRMAEPGSLAAARVASELGISTVFTLAPDPHGPIEAAERDGGLDRRSFAAEDARSALWFRANLVQQLSSAAQELVLFPRPGLRRRLHELVGIDLTAGPPRHTIVPEGIDTGRSDAAKMRLATGAHAMSVMADLRHEMARLPASRHGLPIVVSVGRMRETKGMARAVEAFALDEKLAAASNLVIVGGDLDAPSAAEAAELGRIKTVFDRHHGLRDRVVLLGHRPNDDVSLVLAAARLGLDGLIGPSGAYLCASLKEEFGLAIVEAMAAGLPVVTPRVGGPATYVEDGVTGLLVDTKDPVAIALGTRLALRLSRDPATARRTRHVVEERFTLDRMARTLAAVYRISAGARTLAQQVTTEAAA